MMLRVRVASLIAAVAWVASPAHAQEVDAGPDAAVDAAVADAATAEETATEERATADAATLVQELHDAGVQLEEDARVAERSPEIGTVRVRLAASVDELASIAERTNPEALGSTGRSGLSELVRRLEGLDRDRAADDEVLRARIEALGELRERLDEANTRWAESLRVLEQTPGSPEVTRQRAAELLTELGVVTHQVEERTAAVVELSAALVAHREGVAADLGHVSEALSAFRARVFSRTEPPLWAAFGDGEERAILQEPLEGVWTAFIALYGHQLPLHVGFLLLFVVAVLGLSRWTVSRGERGDEDRVRVLDRPVAAALLVGLVATRFIYPRAPIAIFHAAAAVALLPMIRLLPALILRRDMHRPILGLLGLFAVQEMVFFLPLAAPIQRLISLAITLLFLALIVFVLRHGGGKPAERQGALAARVVPWVLRATALLLIISAPAELLGYSNLANLLTPGLLILLYVFFLLLAVVRVLDSVVSATLRSKVAQVSRAGRLHGPLIEQKIAGVLHFLAGLTWLYGALRIFDLEAPFMELVTSILGAELALGSWTLSVGDIVAFVVVLWVTQYVAKTIVFLVEQDVLPRLDLPRGTPATVSRLLGYAIWALGFLAAIGAAGVDMSSVALLISALGVGIGFGLQSVVNNFVSGLILIFERPIRVGDVVEVGGMVARVKGIGIRASIVRTLKGAEVIVPNADLISAQVINWTLSDQQRRVDIPVGVAYGTDPQRVIDILIEASSGIEEILETPATAGLFIGFGASSLDFELRFWLSLKHEWPTVASKTLVEINRLLAEAEIEIPFPQRDLHIRTIAPELASLVEKP